MPGPTGLGPAGSPRRGPVSSRPAVGAAGKDEERVSLPSRGTAEPPDTSAAVHPRHCELLSFQNFSRRPMSLRSTRGISQNLFDRDRGNTGRSFLSDNNLSIYSFLNKSNHTKVIRPLDRTINCDSHERIFINSANNKH